MAGNSIGGKKAAARNRMLYGKDFYRHIGHLGGKISSGGGFAHDFVGADALTGPERARIAGSKGGQASRRRRHGE